MLIVVLNHESNNEKELRQCKYPLGKCRVCNEILVLSGSIRWMVVHLTLLFWIAGDGTCTLSAVCFK